MGMNDNSIRLPVELLEQRSYMITTRVAVEVLERMRARLVPPFKIIWPDDLKHTIVSAVELLNAFCRRPDGHYKIDHGHEVYSAKFERVVSKVVKDIGGTLWVREIGEPLPKAKRRRRLITNPSSPFERLRKELQLLSGHELFAHK